MPRKIGSMKKLSMECYLEANRRRERALRNEALRARLCELRARGSALPELRAMRGLNAEECDRANFA